MLTELGVRPTQLTTYGAGIEPTPFRINDLKDGKLIESEAAKNRAVYIINTKFDAAKSFI